MTIPLLGLDHMAKSQRTYQWVNGRIQDVGSTRATEAIEAVHRPVQKPARRTSGLDFQTGLLVFTCSSVIMVFSGGALCAFLFVAYSIIFG
jgi:hypothetical protein